MNRTWTVEIDGKKHEIGLDYPEALRVTETGTFTLAKEGKLVVDGTDIEIWKKEEDFPKEVSFAIGGKPAAIRKKGLFGGKMELFVEGKQIK